MSDIVTCPLCGRELPRSEESKHHLIPKMKGGAKGPIAIIHRVCHIKIHSVFTEADLAAVYNNIESLQQHPDIAKFIKWVNKKAPDYYDHSISKNPK